MALPYSICGLLAEEGVEPYAWQTGFYWQDLVEPDPAVAVEFVEHEMDREGLDVGHTLVTFLAARVHSGNIQRCDGIPNADFEVDGDEEFRLHPEPSLHTVCGMIYPTGKPYCDLWMSHGPRVAYVDAWQCIRDEGQTLLVACVHTGDETEDGLQFDFALPAIKNADEMEQVLKEIWTP
jgi:hypothetical protein